MRCSHISAPLAGWHLSGRGQAKVVRCLSINASSVVAGRPPIVWTKSFVPAKTPFWWSIATSRRCWMTKESPARRSGACLQRSGVVSGRRLLRSGGHHLEHGLNAHLLVLDFFSEHAAENIGDPLIVELDRTVQRVRLVAVLTGVFHNPHDNARLILSGNWCMAAGAERHVEQPGVDHGREIQQPLCKIRWPQVYDCEARPVEDTLG